LLISCNAWKDAAGVDNLASVGNNKEDIEAIDLVFGTERAPGVRSVIRLEDFKNSA